MITTGVLIWLYLSLLSLTSVLEFGIFLFYTALLGTAFFGLLHVADEGDEKVKDWLKKCAGYAVNKFAILAILLVVLIPSKEDLTYIFGGMGVYGITQIERAEQLPENVVNAMNRFLETLNEETATEE